MSKSFKEEAQEELAELERLQDADIQRLNAIKQEEIELTNRIVERRGSINALQKLLRPKAGKEK